MNSREFFDKVSKMRSVQKEYFKTRDKDILNESKRLEREIDSEIERVNRILNKQKDE